MVVDDAFVATHQREHPNRNAVIVMLINPNGEILLVRTRRLPNHWQALGGGIEPDDLSAKDAAAREVKEEVGIVLRPEDLVHLCDAP
jgi:8-oxo-dGTP pyrophosphatase MutT (NUDIX family)